MKKKVVSIIGVIILLVTLCSCISKGNESSKNNPSKSTSGNIIGSSDGTHTHNYSLQYDDDYHYSICSCGDVINKEKHTFGEWNVIKESTATSKGSKERKCSICNYTETVEVAMLNHKHSITNSYQFDENYHWFYCFDCKQKVSMVKHNYSLGNITTSATTTKSGIKEYVCKDCNHKMTETIEAHTHNFKNNICTICGETNAFTTDEVENGLTITKYVGDNSVTELVIPEYIEGKKVTRIEKGVLQDLTNLKSIAIPFVGENLDSTGNSLFEWIFGAEFSFEIGQYAPASLTNVEVTNGTILRANSFVSEHIEYISLPNALGEIENGAISCTNLKSIELPYVGGTLKKNQYFGYIFGATSAENQKAVLPKNLTSVKINQGKIENMAFYDCSLLTNIQIPQNLVSIGELAFYGTGITKIDLPVTTKVISSEAFSNCKLLDKLEIPDGITKIGKDILYNTNSLKSLVLPSAYFNSNDPIGYLFATTSFYDSYKIKQNNIVYYVPNTLSEIVVKYGDLNYEAFKDMKNLTSIALPSDLKKIPNSSFYGCTNLIDIEIPESVIEIGENVFTGANDDLKIYCQSKKISEDWPSNWNSFKRFYLGYDVKKIINVNSVKYLITGNDTVTLYDYQLKNTNFALPNTITYKDVTYKVTKIGSSAFYNNDSLETLSINRQNNLVKIEPFAFYNCTKLNAITLYQTKITTIEEYTFYNCSSIKNISLPKEITNLKTYSFYNCSSIEEFNFLGNLNDWENLIIEGEFSNPLYYSKNTYFIENSKQYNINNYTSIEINNNTGFAQYANFKGLTNIEITDKVTSVGNSAFYGCNGLTSIKIPNSVVYIEKYAFFNCNNITNVIISANVECIGKSAFGECSNLASITLPFIGDKVKNPTSTYFGYIFGASTYFENSKYIPSSLKEVTLTMETTIRSYAFYDCSSLTSITIPNSVTSIENYIFEKCDGLISIIVKENSIYDSRDDCNAIIETKTNKLIIGCKNTIIPNSVTSIGEYAFYDCSVLTNITIPNSVTSIEEYAFYGCSGLTNITIPNSVISIEEYAFYGCNGLTNITIPNSVTSIEEYAFYGCNGLTNITISDSVTSIGKSTFEKCSNLVSITLPFIGDKVKNPTSTYFGYIFGASTYFENSKYVPSSLKEVIVTTTTSIGDRAFSGCNNLKNIELQADIKKIGSYVCYGCSSLVSITLPDVDYLGYIFGASSYSENSKYVPSSLKEVTLISGRSIDSRVFNGCSGLTSIIIPESVSWFDKGVFSSCNSLVSITLPFIGDKFAKPTNTYFGYIFGASSYSENSKYVPSSLKEVILTMATTIETYAFSGCEGLKSITIPNSITSIREGAFDGCDSLEKVNITDIEAWCKIYFPLRDSNPLFYAHKLYLNNELITNLVIPNSVTSIRKFAFYSICDYLTSITIPNSVTNIEIYAFYGNISKIYYIGDSSEWEKLSNRPKGKVYYYSETKPTTSGNYWHYVDEKIEEWEFN